MKYIFAAVLIFFTWSFSYSIPQYSLLSGNKCINCHVNGAGGGARNSLGWYAKKDDGLIKPSWIGLGSTFDAIDGVNNIFNNKARFGFDLRLLSYRGGGAKLADRKIILMQAEPYLVISPMNGLNIVGNVNFEMDDAYPGQSPYNAYVQYQPGSEYPWLQIGVFQPPIGIRFDDHTEATKQYASPYPRPLYPPDYSELGAMLNYEDIKWLGLSAGLFSQNYFNDITLSDNIGLTPKKSVSSLVKAVFSPRFFENNINTHIGGSWYHNNSGNFDMYNLFAGVGYSDLISLIGEYAVSKNKDRLNTDNFTIELAYQPFGYFLLYGRMESAYSDYLLQKAQYDFGGYVFGGKIDLLPYIALQPEYRILKDKSKSSYTAYYSIQLHVFY